MSFFNHRGALSGYRQAGWLALLVLAAPCPAAPSSWPGGARAAVSLAYDDALDSQLDHALPALDKAALKGSFYLQLSNPAVTRRLPEWRAAAGRGHELGNHTLFHQCSGAGPDRTWVLPQRDLGTTTVVQMADQVALANAMLHAIDGLRERTFTVPCGDVQARGGNYLGAVASEFIAIKVGAATGGVKFSAIDPYAVAVVAPVGVSGAQLIEMVKQAGANDALLNLTFHGIGGDYLTVSAEAHAELLAYLAANRDLYWTDTFVNIMKYVKSRQASGAAGAKRPPPSGLIHNGKH
jgi:peptidoglycan/xylan/chitin deacetylase (PgdA/CDA1 family)